MGINFPFFEQLLLQSEGRFQMHLFLFTIIVYSFQLQQPKSAFKRQDMGAV